MRLSYFHGAALWRPRGRMKGREKSEATKSFCFTAFCKPVLLQAPQGPHQPDSLGYTQPRHTKPPTSNTNLIFEQAPDILSFFLTNAAP